MFINHFRFLFFLKKQTIRFFLISGIVISILSCDREPGEIGLNLQPGSDRMDLFIDTLSIESYTMLDDSIASDERTLSPLGSYIDPIFGFAKADFFTHVRLSSANVNFADAGVNADSLVLHLQYSGYYGNLGTSQKIKVYRVRNKKIYADSVYYSSHRFDAVDLEELAVYDFEPDENDSIVNIHMPNSLLAELTNSNNANYFSSNDNFIDFFRGLYITTDAVNADGAIYYFNLLSANSKMTLYYNDSLSFNFLINAACARINMFEHDYSLASADLVNTIDNFDTPNDISYLQSLGGLKVKLFVNDLVGLDTLRFAINKAELQITVNQEFMGQFDPPENLTLVAINEDGLNEFLTDYKINLSYFGGKLSKTSYTYTFNIPFHIQELITHQERLDNGIFLFPLDNRTNASRTAIYGGNHPQYSMKIIIMYSKF